MGESRKFEYRQAAEHTLTTEYRHRIMQGKGGEKCLTKKIYRRSKMIDASEERTRRYLNFLFESDVTPKFNLLADGIKDIQEKLVPRSRVDDLEDEVKFLKLMCRQMAEGILLTGKRRTEYTIQQDGADVRHRHILSGRGSP